MTSPAGTPFASHVSISWLPEFSPWTRRLPASAGSVISFLLIHEDPTPLVLSRGTHLNNISPAPAADHSMHCFRRWMTYETWWVGCMNYLRPSFCFLFSLFHVSISFSFPKRILRWPPGFWESAWSPEGTVKDILFSVLALYCMILNFGHVGVGWIFWLV